MNARNFTLPARISMVLKTAIVTVALYVCFFLGLVFEHPLTEGFWIAGPDDDFAALTGAVLDFEQRFKDGNGTATQESVVIIGSSALREAIVSTEYLHSEDPTREWSLWMAGDLLAIEALQIVRALPRDIQGRLILEVSMRTLSTSEEVTQQLIQRPRIPWQTVYFQKDIRSLGYSMGTGVGWATFFVSRWDWRKPTKVPQESWLFHQVDFFEPAEVNWTHLIEKKYQWMRDVPFQLERNLALYHTILEAVPSGMTVQLVHSPRNPKWIASTEQDADLRAITALLQQAYDQLEAWSGQSIWTLDSDISSHHFLDHGHINTQKGRLIATQRLLTLVGE